MQLTFPQREVSPFLSPALAPVAALLAGARCEARRGGRRGGRARADNLYTDTVIICRYLCRGFVDTIIDTTTAIASIHNNRLHFTHTTSVDTHTELRLL